MHRRIDAIYQHCDHGCSHHLSANLEEGTFAGVRQAFEKAIAFLHGKKTFRPEHLKSKAVAGYISETFNVLKAAVKEGIAHEIPAKMMNRLNSSVFLFSGMKVFTALKESQLTLTDEKGQVKTWDRFKADAKAIDSKYNENYLRAERRYAVDAAHATGEWNRFWKDKDLFDLEYLTDNGPNVRDSHRALEHTVLPMDASFWSSYFPPNGWNCHCKVVRVPKGDKPHSDNDEAVRKGEASTTVLDKNGKNSAAIFRYNPGKQQIIFPEKHPYYPQHCNGEKLNLSGWMGLGKWLLATAAERCKALNVLKESAQYRNIIYGAPVKEQYQTIFESKTGKKVDAHQLANEDKETYKEILYAAKAMANDNIGVKIQPEINISDKQARITLLPNYTHPSANPDLLTEKGIFIDVKTPRNYKNINGLAVHAAYRQNAEALITDKRLKLKKENTKKIALRVFMDKNYNKNSVHFVIDGKYYVEHR